MGRSVLVADDDPTTQKILRVTLECAGYEVIATSDGEEALRTLAGWLPDFVVLDVMMPKLDGFTILRHIRQDPRTAGVPVVLLTGRSAPDDLWRGWQEGVDYYLTKPFDSEELLRVMDRILADGARRAEAASQPAQEPAPVVEIVPPAAPSPPVSTAAVLVVDDDPAIHKVLRLNLELDGYEVDSAYDGEEALDRIARCRPDLVILDVMMPRVDGLEVLRRIRGHGATADIPVILLTARSKEQDVWQGWQHGVDYYMTKPFDVEELLRSMERLLAGRRPSA